MYRRLRVGGPDDTTRASKAVTIDRPADAIYDFCHDFRNSAQLFGSVQSVERQGERFRIAVAGPGGDLLHGEVAIVEERPNESIAWRSTLGMSGCIRLREAPGARGTEVALEVESGGFRVPQQGLQRPVAETVRRVKRFLETGEIPTTRDQPSGKRSPIGRVLSARRERSVTS